MVFDLNGKLMNTVPETSFGKGAITINGSALNPGMFVYSLIVDEKIIDTKRMVTTQQLFRSFGHRFHEFSQKKN